MDNNSDQNDTSVVPFDILLLEQIKDLPTVQTDPIAQAVLKEIHQDIIQYWPLLAVKYLRLPVPLGACELTWEHKRFINLVIQSLCAVMNDAVVPMAHQLRRHIVRNNNANHDNVLNFIRFVEAQRQHR